MAVSGIYKKLIFDGQSSGDYGVYITGEAVFNAPVRDVEMVEIPGRNGTLALDKGRFENIEVSYPAGIFADNERDFAEAVSSFRNFLCSRSGYCRLEDDYNPDEYRMAVYKSGLEVDPRKLMAGEFDLVFDCKPQRWLKSGEDPVTIGEWGETETETGEVVEIDNSLEILSVKDLKVAILSEQEGSGTPTPTNIRPFKNIDQVTIYRNSDEVVVSLGAAVYGGTLDVTTGELKLNKLLVSFDGSEDWINNTGDSVSLELPELISEDTAIGDRYVYSESQYQNCWAVLDAANTVGTGKVGEIKTRR